MVPMRLTSNVMNPTIGVKAETVTDADPGERLPHNLRAVPPVSMSSCTAR